MTRDRAFAAALVSGFLVLLWWTIGNSSRAESRRRYQATLIADVIPTQPLHFHGNIRLVGIMGNRESLTEAERIPGQYPDRAGCDAVCAALLALPDVDSVTIVDKSRRPAAWRFHLVAKEECSGPGVIPQRPDSLRLQRGPLEADSGDRPDEGLQAQMVAGRSVETAWRIRLSATDCIIADNVGTASTFIIRDDRQVAFGNKHWSSRTDKWAWTFDALPVSIRRLEIRDSKGVVRLRRSFTSTPILSKPLRPGTVGSKGGGLPLPVFGWSRDRLQNFGKDEEYDARAMLLEHTNIVEGLETAISATAIAAELRRVLDDPNVPASDPVFPLSEIWMQSLTPETVTDADKVLLIDLIKDLRVNHFQGIRHAAGTLGDGAQMLVEPIRWRIEVDSGNKSVVHALAGQLDKLWEYVTGPSESELRILNDPVKRLHAEGLIIRQGDYGAAAVPLLVRIMREHMVRTRDARLAEPHARIPAEIGPIDAAMVALCRIGPDASAAMPEIRAMKSSWLGDRLANDRQWQFALARIGWPLNELKPPRGSGQSPQQYALYFRRRLDDFDEGRDCRESWS